MSQVTGPMIGVPNRAITEEYNCLRLDHCKGCAVMYTHGEGHCGLHKVNFSILQKLCINWNAHIILFGKISRNTVILNKIKLFLPRSILKTIYSSIILCQLNYGILVWGQNYKRIFKLQKRVMRIITCSKYNAHSEPLFIPPPWPSG